jgi:DNA-binding NarL/FixJ family response regulator
MSEKQALVVDDHPIVRLGIKHLLTKAFPSIYIRESPGTDGVVEEICGSGWAFVTLDIRLLGQNGLHIIRQLKTCCPGVPIIVFSLFSEDQYRSRALREGAAAYVSKDRSPVELVEAVRSVLLGKKQQLEKRRIKLTLSDRERQVLKLLARGLGRQQIADALGISDKTVSTYKMRLQDKLNARTTIDLIRFAVDERLIST